MRILFTSLIILLCQTGYSQNMVPDSSFEVYNNCPSGLGQVQCPLNPWVIQQTIINWFSPLSNSPDYFHNCAPAVTHVHVPNNNFFGYIPPRTGDGFTAIVPYMNFPNNNTPNTNYREYLECQLIQPMVAGQTYYISLYVRHFIRDIFFPGGGDHIALDALQGYFSTTMVTNLVSPITLSGAVPLQLPSQGFITDTTWVRIFGEYTATGGEQFFTLGSFNNGIVPPIQLMHTTPPSSSGSEMAYYFIDDVSIRTTPFVTCDTTIAVRDTTLCTTQPVILTATAPTATSYTWSTGATTPDISVSTAGIFWRVATDGCNAQIDTFKVKLFNNTITRAHDSVICAASGTVALSSVDDASSYMWNTGATTQSISTNQNGTFFCISIKNCILYTDTFHVSSFQTYSVTHDTAACFPATIPLTAELNADSYLWNTGATTNSITIAEPGNYSCEAIKGCDLYISNFAVTTNAAIEGINIGKDTIICKEERISVGQEYEGVSYLWNTGATTPRITPAYPGTYIVQVNDGCKILRDSVTIDMVACQDCIFIPTAFTPNGDGKNDDIGAIPKCPLSSFSLIIANRFGEVVHESSDINARWNGRYKGQPCDVGTYYYMIQYTSAGDGKEHIQKGDITLIH